MAAETTEANNRIDTINILCRVLYASVMPVISFQIFSSLSLPLSGLLYLSSALPHFLSIHKLAVVDVVLQYTYFRNCSVFGDVEGEEKEDLMARFYGICCKARQGLCR